MQKLDSEKVEVPSLLTANKVRTSLKNLEGWQLTNDSKMVYREFIVHDFMAAIDMIDRIALIAEDEKHHPDIHLTQYRNLRISLTTHDVAGLSEKDFIVALKINDLPVMNNKAVPINQQLKNRLKQRQGVSLALKKNHNKTKELQRRK